MAHEEGVDVTPPPPGIAVQREQSRRSLLRCQRCQERLSGLPDRGRGRAGLLEREEIWNQLAIRGNARERLHQGGFCGL